MSETPVPFLDLGPELDRLGDRIEQAIARVLASRRFILGEELTAFENEFAAYCGVGHGIGVASGTDAIELALRALGIGEGDEVITVSHTFIATPLAISATGATPVFVDVRDHDGLIDPAAAAAAVTARTRAIVPVHLYGRCAEIDALGELARAHDLHLVEDAAQAHGARVGDRRAGSLGEIACFSFYPSKNLGALGDAGAVLTDDPALAERVRRLRNYGETRKYEHELRGRNSRLDELQAAVLRAKLPDLDAGNEARRGHAAEYARRLEGSSVVAPPPAGPDDVVHLYVVRSEQRDELRTHLERNGIGTQIHYPVPAHAQAAYGDHTQVERLPVTERLAAEVLSLPLYPALEPEQLEAVCRAVRSFDSG